MELSTGELKAALRFCETCEDDEGYDVPAPMMKRLAELGLVAHYGFGRYAGMPRLNRLLEEYESGAWREFNVVAQSEIQE